MRRALLEEHVLEALRMRCADAGARINLEVDLAGEAVVRVGDRRFTDWDDTLAHVAELESAAGVQA